MSKREATMFAAQGVDVDAPRAKRQKTGTTTTQGVANSTTSGDGPAANGAGSVSGENEKPSEDPEQVKEKGLKLWQTIKDAKDKDGRQVSADFMRLPSKRQYPDYYVQIKRPIALDDIKRRLEGGSYPLFDEVRGDFEQCFKNAKKYNMKESQIWKDAKHLHKLVTKESVKLTGVPAGDEAGDAEADGDGISEDEGKKKKAPSMYRLLKARLQKLVDKTDDEGRVLSAEFMELPNRKQWGMYYKVIKKPQCFENIFKRLKRKEYATPLDFANDVELVFSNALEFNQEGTQIWEDTLVLRDYFRQLMSDLPVPFSIPAYASSDHSTKVKLKIPGGTQASPANQASTSTLALAPASAATASPRPVAAAPTPVPLQNVRSPPAQVGSPATFTSIMSPPAAAKPTPPTMNGVPATPPIAAATQPYQPPIAPMATTAVSTMGHVQPAYGSAYTQHYPAAAYRAPVPATSLPNANTINPARSYAPQPAVQAPTLNTQRSQSQVPIAKSPTPPETSRPLRHVAVATKSLGRRLDLDYREGVRVWSVRLGRGETGVRVSEVRFLEEADEPHSDGEGKEPAEVERREEEEEEEEEQAPPPPVEEKPVKRGRGRPKKKRTKAVTESPKGKGKAAPKPPPPTPSEVQVKLNSVVATPTEEGVWDIELAIGLNIIEVGAKGGMTWRIYLDRIAAAQ